MRIHMQEIKLDVAISYEEANFIRETFAEQFNVRELQLIACKRRRGSISKEKRLILKVLTKLLLVNWKQSKVNW